MRALHVLLLVAALTASATPIPRVFKASVTEPGTHQDSAYHGESLAIEAHLVDGRAPFPVPVGASAMMYVSTNSVNWWTWPASVSTDGVIRATWVPAYDCGADSYRIFLGVSESGTNVNYGANMLLRLLGSPGETPNALPLPVNVIDFARISYTNEPWATSSGLTTNDVRAIVEADAGPTNRIVRADGDGNVHVAGIFAGEEGTGTGGFAGRFDGTVDVYGGMYVFGEAYLNDEQVAVEGDIVAASAETRRWTASIYGEPNSWMEVSGDTLGVYCITNLPSGPTTNTIWKSSSAIGGSLAVVAERATSNTTRITALERRPDLTSWGDYAPDGSPNPDAEAMVYLNKALTLMGSGFSWATSGAYACLCQSGSVAFHAETNGELRIGLDVVSNYFGMVQGGSITVGCRTDGIRVEGSGDNTVVYLLYAYAGGEFPVIWGMTSLVGDKTELSPVWTDYGDGTAEAAVPGKPFYFFTATSSKRMEARFESKAPAAFPGGIYGSFMSPPVKYDSVITVQAGGHTYRIPAELVQ